MRKYSRTIKKYTTYKIYLQNSPMLNYKRRYDV